jgi:MerR family transcriptional regulator/heat shock protein HspR
LYSLADIERLRRIKSLTEDMGVNLAGAEVALKLMVRIEELEHEVKGLTDQVRSIQARQGNRTPAAGNPASSHR